MTEDKLLDLKKGLEKNKIILSFSGFFSQIIIEYLGNALKAYFSITKMSMKTTNDVFSVFIEQTQNIRNYYTKKNEENEEIAKNILSSGIAIIGKEDDNFYIYSGNLVENCDVKELEEKINEVKNLSKIEAKVYFKNKLFKERPNNSIGAGLGLIDIVRKSSLPIEYSLIKKDEKFYFYTIKAIVSN